MAARRKITSPSGSVIPRQRGAGQATRRQKSGLFRRPFPEDERPRGAPLKTLNDTAPNHPAAPNAGIASQLTIKHQWPGVGEPGRVKKFLSNPRLKCLRNRMKMKASIMKTKSAKIIVGSVIALWALVSICIVGVRAQQPPNNPVPGVTTNWVGYLVAGRNDPHDRITPHPSPTVERQVEIGLRSDGVVVWREAGKVK